MVSVCVPLRLNRLRNDNKLCALLAETVESCKWKVYRETKISVPNLGTGVPDLILVKHKTALIIDVAICYDCTYRMYRK